MTDCPRCGSVFRADRNHRAVFSDLAESPHELSVSAITPSRAPCLDFHHVRVSDVIFITDQCRSPFITCPRSGFLSVLNIHRTCYQSHSPCSRIVRREFPHHGVNVKRRTKVPQIVEGICQLLFLGRLVGWEVQVLRGGKRSFPKGAE